MEAVFGVHFGSTTACLAVCKDGKCDVVANEAGDRVTPAVVAYTDHEVTVGLPAKQGIIRNASNTVRYVKQLMGRPFEDDHVQRVISSSPVNIINKSGAPCFEVDFKGDTKVFTPQDVATKVFKNLHDIAARQSGKDETYDTVVTVPFYFNDKQRQSICEVAEEAGFNILRVISEPASALLAYGIGQESIYESCYAVIYKLGGESLDVTVARVTMGMFQILSTVSTHEYSGRHFTEQLVEYLVTEFKRKWKGDCRTNKRSLMKLHNAAENCKHVLSTMQTSQCSIDSLYDGIDFQCTVSRGRFEGLCSNLVQNCVALVDDAVKRAGLTHADINKVVLCGGSSKLPMLQSKISSSFSTAQVLSNLSPDEVIALGAVKQASILAGHNYEESQENEADNELPCLAKDIFVEAMEADSRVQEVVLPQWTPVPVRKTFTFKLPEDQNDFVLHVQAGRSGDSVSLAKVVMKEVSSNAEIQAVFHAKGDGSLHITCTDAGSSKSQSVTVEST